jgi:predicted TIM-barrel fold metal-dependent hydrolase
MRLELRNSPSISRITLLGENTRSNQMIVDVHTHVWERPAHLSDTFVRDARITARNANLEIAVDLDEHWAAMAPVDHAIVLGFRARHVGVLVPNEYVASYVTRHPEKLIGFCSVDPHDADALDQLDHAVALGLRGLKVGPIYQNIHPSDQRFVALMARAEALGLPVLIHQGTTFCENVSLELANPVLLQAVALQFPELRMVIAHLGHPWIAETIVLIRKHRHLYSDISALYYRPWQFYNALVMAMEYGVLDRLLFGTDYPFTTPASTIAALRRVNDIVEGTNLPRIPMERIEAMIHRDALALLGLGG